MRESYSFRSIKGELEKKKEAAVQPSTAVEREGADHGPMTIKDHWLSLRQSIQEKVVVEKPSAEEYERTKAINELISPALAKEYQEIVKDFDRRARTTKQHPSRECIDIHSDEVAPAIHHWVEGVIDEVKRRKEKGLDEDAIEELRGQCWLFFDALSSVMNTKSLERDITEFFEGAPRDVIDTKALAKQRKELIQQLRERYAIDVAEAEVLIDLVRSGESKNGDYSPTLVIETIARLWSEYKLGERKGTIAKISLGYLLGKGAESFAPSLFQNILANDKFNAAVFLEYFGLNKLAEFIDAKADIELAKVINDINHQINERITNSLFFQEFEFIHDKPLGEIYATLERGKDATAQMLRDTISTLGPSLAGIGMSLAFLTRINPLLGAIGIGSVPIMYVVAKRQNEQLWPMYEREQREGEKIATRLGSIKSGFEEVKTSSETPAIASHVKAQMDTKDTLSLARTIEETKMRLKSLIPFDVSTVSAACVGGALQEAGMISGGAILSNIMYSNQLNRPVQELVRLYFNRFSRYIQDIQRMDEILGKYEKLDLPEGEKEKDRIPVSDLENFDISIRGLTYKDILRGVDLTIRQGEFVTIAGASGAGKSTLLRTLVGLYRPDGGDIEIGGVSSERVKKYGKESLYSVMSYCNQTPQIFEGMTLRENLLLWSKEEVSDERMKQVLKDLHLEKFLGDLDKEVKHLSGGEKVRMGVARTLIKGAKVMLLDEPTASLDSRAATEVRKIIGEINEKYPDTTIICVTHDEELIKGSERSVQMAELQAVR